ncbi:MAG: 30S processome protein Utp24 [Candidatus Methanomethylicia archaeon]
MDRKCITVLLDTNILILAINRSIDIFSEIERLIPELHRCAVLSSVVDELNKLASLGSNKDKILARAALKIVNRCEVIHINSYTDTDESILYFAKNNRGGIVVATNDFNLKHKLRDMGIPVIYLRDFDHLDIEGEIF